MPNIHFPLTSIVAIRVPIIAPANVVFGRLSWVNVAIAEKALLDLLSSSKVASMDDPLPPSTSIALEVDDTAARRLISSSFSNTPVGMNYTTVCLPRNYPNQTEGKLDGSTLGP